MSLASKLFLLIVFDLFIYTHTAIFLGYFIQFCFPVSCSYIMHLKVKYIECNRLITDDSKQLTENLIRNTSLDSTSVMPMAPLLDPSWVLQPKQTP